MLRHVLCGVGVAIMDDVTSSSFNIKPSHFSRYSLEAFLFVARYGLWYAGMSTVRLSLRLS